MKNVNKSFFTDGFEFLHIKFAPLSVPFQRRWEIFCVLCMLMCLVIPQPLMPLIMYYLYRLSPSLFFLNIVWIIYDWNTPLTGGRRNCFVRKWFAPVQRYFPSKIVKTTDNIKTGHNYLFATFPHGFICNGVMTNFVIDVNCAEAFPGIKIHLVVLKTFFALPIVREYFLFCGLSASTESNILSLLSSEEKNKAVILLVGGAMEALYTNPGKCQRIILNQRKGFVRLALKAGSPIVPVYTFGENELYSQIRNDKWLKFQNTVRKWTGIPPFLVNGRGFFQYTFGVLPRRVPLNTVVGKPIVVPQIDNPLKEDIEKYHAIFKKDLIELFNAHKEKYDPNGRDAELIVM